MNSKALQKEFGARFGQIRELRRIWPRMPVPSWKLPARSGSVGPPVESVELSRSERVAGRGRMIKMIQAKHILDL